MFTLWGAHREKEVGKAQGYATALQGYAAFFEKRGANVFTRCGRERKIYAFMPTTAFTTPLPGCTQSAIAVGKSSKLARWLIHASVSIRPCSIRSKMWWKSLATALREASSVSSRRWKSGSSSSAYWHSP